jgi:hypothetical protein
VPKPGGIWSEVTIICLMQINLAISGFPNNKIAYDIRPVLNLHSF